MKAIQDDGSLMRLCGNQACLFFFSSCDWRYRTRPVCCVSQTTGRTPDLNPSLNLLDSERVWFKGQAYLWQFACVWCRVSILRDSGKSAIHSRLNMSVSGRHDNGWWWSYTRTYPLCGKIFHVQDFFTPVLIQIVDTYIYWTFTLWKTLEDAGL